MATATTLTDALREMRDDLAEHRKGIPALGQVHVDRPAKAVMYHGTSAADFDEFEDRPTYLTPDEDHAAMFAHDPSMGGGGGAGDPRVLRVKCAPGTCVDITPFTRPEFDKGVDGDVDGVVARLGSQALADGHSYVEFDHPSAHHDADKGVFRSVVALKPSRDLKIEKYDDSQSRDSRGRLGQVHVDRSLDDDDDEDDFAKYSPDQPRAENGRWGSMSAVDADEAIGSLREIGPTDDGSGHFDHDRAGNPKWVDGKELPGERTADGLYRRTGRPATRASSDAESPIPYAGKKLAREMHDKFGPSYGAEGGAGARYSKETVSVDPSRLETWQTRVTPSTVADKLERGEPKGHSAPRVIKYKGHLIVSDGNHRAVAAMLSGARSLDVRVKDLDAARVRKYDDSQSRDSRGRFGSGTSAMELGSAQTEHDRLKDHPARESNASQTAHDAFAKGVDKFGDRADRIVQQNMAALMSQRTSTPGMSAYRAAKNQVDAGREMLAQSHRFQGDERMWRVDTALSSFHSALLVASKVMGSKWVGKSADHVLKSRVYMPPIEVHRAAKSAWDAGMSVVGITDALAESRGLDYEHVRMVADFFAASESATLSIGTRNAYGGVNAAKWADKVISKAAREWEPWVGVDLDGTLAMPTQSYDGTAIGAPIKAMVDKVKSLLAAGKKVKVFTARVADDPDGKRAKAIRRWCLDVVGQELPVTNEKDPGMVELWDDRAHNPDEYVGKYSDDQPRGEDGKWGDGSGGRNAYTSKETKAAFQIYQSETHSSSLATDKVWSNFDDIIQAKIEGSPLVKDTTLYRGGGIPADVKAGDVLTGRGEGFGKFTSATKSTYAAERFADKDKSSLVMRISAKAGQPAADVVKITGNSSEAEFLLGKGVEFKVTGVGASETRQGNSYRYVDVTIVGKSAVAKTGSGVMVAFMLDKSTADKLAVPGGEDPADMHVTLAYLGKPGAVDMTKMPALESAVKDYAAMHAPVSGTIDGPVRFGAKPQTEGRDVCVAAFCNPGIQEFRAGLVGAIKAVGIDVPRPFDYRPHVCVKYIPVGEDMPVQRIPPTPVTFGAITLCVAGERESFPLSGDVVKYSPDQPRDDKGKFGVASGDVVSRESGNWTYLSVKGGAGSMDLQEKNGQMRVREARVSADSRGGGLGVAMYERAVEVAHGKGMDLVSDEAVSPDADHVWQALRTRGYNVARAETELSHGSQPKYYAVDRGTGERTGASVWTAPVVAKYSPDQPRADNGEFGSVGGARPKVSVRVESARKSFVLIGTKEQATADRAEQKLADALGVPRTRDNSAFDLRNDDVGIEVKTLLSNTNDKITMNKSALSRKLGEAAAEGLKTFTVVADMRGRTNAQYYVTNRLGSLRLGGMTKVSIKELRDMVRNA